MVAGFIYCGAVARVPRIACYNIAPLWNHWKQSKPFNFASRSASFAVLCQRENRNRYYNNHSSFADASTSTMCTLFDCSLLGCAHIQTQLIANNRNFLHWNMKPKSFRLCCCCFVRESIVDDLSANSSEITNCEQRQRVSGGESKEEDEQV